jgi:hypothetical protein
MTFGGWNHPGAEQKIRIIGHQGPRKTRSAPIKKELNHWKAGSFLRLATQPSTVIVDASLDNVKR